MTFGKIGARRMMYKWRNPYPAMDSCIAWWDGEWNAGGGKHDVSLGKILDLSGRERDITMPSAWTLGDNYINSKTSGVNFLFSQTEMNAIIANGMTAEIVAKTIGSSGLFGWSAYGGLSATYNTSQGAIFLTAQYSVVGGGPGTGGAQYVNITTGSAGNHVFSVTAEIGGPSIVYCDGEVKSNYRSLGGFRGDAYNMLMCFYGWGQQADDLSLYSIRFHSRALTASEIAANYAVDKERFNLP